MWPFGSEEYTNLSSGINFETKPNSTKNNTTTLLHKQKKGFKFCIKNTYPPYDIVFTRMHEWVFLP